MNDGELFDLAAARAEQERDAAILTARVALSSTGSENCVECAGPILAARKAAAPFARRCVECQTFHEAEKYHR